MAGFRPRSLNDSRYPALPSRNGCAVRAAKRKVRKRTVPFGHALHTSHGITVKGVLSDNGSC